MLKEKKDIKKKLIKKGITKNKLNLIKIKVKII